MTYDAIVIGGGAAGLFCAITAGRRGKRVLVVEHNADVGRKIIISGGGRCNFTNTGTTAENFISQNPHFCKSALSCFTPQDFVALVRRHSIQYYEKKLGQMFCRTSSRPIVDMLIAEARLARVEIRTSCSVTTVDRSDVFHITTSQGKVAARNLVIACGGLSFRKIGATDLGYRIARQFGIKIIDTRPSLVGLVLAGESLRKLAGVSVDALVSSGEQSFRENILFTHRGMSGPAILQISNYWKKDREVAINLLPENLLVAEPRDREDNRKLSTVIGRLLPQRFADDFVRRKLVNKPIGKMNVPEIEAAQAALSEWKVKFRETEGYDRAEVTLGGVSTHELSSQTMEAKKKAGLYFIGEVVDVTGWLGGYNFQWAWASGFAAGTAI